MGGGLWIARRNAGGAEFPTMGWTLGARLRGRVADPAGTSDARIRSLAYRGRIRLSCRLLFFAIGAGNVAERRGLGQRRTEFRERTLSVGAGNATTSEQRLLGCQLMQVGMKRMA